MTEPMKTADLDLLIDRIWSRAYLDTKEKHVGLIKEYAAQQVAVERERIKEKVRGLMFTMPTGRVPREGLNIAFYKVLELIDSL